MRIAVLYGSKYGFTKEVAMQLGGSLGDHVSLYNLMEETPMLEDYDGFVIGSSIYMGKGRKEVVEFVMQNKKALLEKRVWLFLSCANRESFMDQALGVFGEELVNSALLTMRVGFALSREKMNIFDKMVMKIIKRNDNFKERQMDELAVESLIHSIKLEMER